MKLSFQQEAGYLIVEASGDWTAPNAEAAIAEAHAEMTRRGLWLMFLDARGVSEPDFEVTRFITGKRWAEAFDNRFRTACWSRPENYTGFGETVAQNRGAIVKVFFERGDALKWLLDDRAKAGG